MARVGLMLYTVREDCDRDLEGTLREVAAIGYEGVELFSLHGHTPEQVRRWLDEVGLVVSGRHIGLAALDGGLTDLALEANVLGYSRVAVSWIDPDSLSEPGDVADRLRSGASAAELHGLQLGFHNHDAEVRDLGEGETFLDVLLRASPLFLEIDLGWVWWAGVDPVSVLEAARGRAPLVHVKDFRARGERSFCPVGDGAVDFGRILPVAVEQGAEWLLVEQDEAEGSALDAARRSYAAVTKLLGRP